MWVEAPEYQPWINTALTAGLSFWSSERMMLGAPGLDFQTWVATTARSPRQPHRRWQAPHPFHPPHLPAVTGRTEWVGCHQLKFSPPQPRHKSRVPPLPRPPRRRDRGCHNSAFATPKAVGPTAGGCTIFSSSSAQSIYELNALPIPQSDVHETFSSSSELHAVHRILRSHNPQKNNNIRQKQQKIRNIFR